MFRIVPISKKKLIKKIPARKCFLYYLMDGPKRYSELKRAIPAITEKMLAQHLKQLREDNLINRKVEQEMPPITIYSLTPSAKKLSPVLMAMADWAIKDSKLYKDLAM